MAFTVVQITDTHNSAHGGDTNENLVKTIEFVNGLNPAAPRRMCARCSIEHHRSVIRNTYAQFVAACSLISVL